MRRTTPSVDRRQQRPIPPGGTQYGLGMMMAMHTQTKLGFSATATSAKLCHVLLNVHFPASQLTLLIRCNTGPKQGSYVPRCPVVKLCMVLV